MEPVEFYHSVTVSGMKPARKLHSVVLKLQNLQKTNFSAIHTQTHGHSQEIWSNSQHREIEFRKDLGWKEP